MLFVKKIYNDAIIPKRATSGSAGYDIHSYGDYEIEPQKWLLLDTGIGFTVPEGTYGQLAPRSGFSCKGTIVGAGVIDRDYTGHVRVLVFNMNTNVNMIIKKGDRIAQLLIKQILTCDVSEVLSLEESTRGGSGFGSTGV
jgi:dUTP pyrophosphatase